MDKKISELGIAQVINADDVSVLVSDNIDYRFSFDLLLSFIGNNLQLGTTVSLGINLPPNTTGNDGDLFINTQSGSFAQKLAGVWTFVYNPTAANVADGTLLYGLGTPSSTNGKNGDSYINTGNGTFYKKSAGSWSTVFTMLNGPPGVKGDKGDKGDAGNNGRTILNGTLNPSNQSDGSNGDFYLNTASMVLFGPKANAAWGPGISLLSDNTVELQSTDARFTYDDSAYTMILNWDADLQAQFPGLTEPTIRYMQKTADNSYKERSDQFPVFTNNGTGIITTLFEGITDDLTQFKLIIKR